MLNGSMLLMMDRIHLTCSNVQVAWIERCTAVCCLCSDKICRHFFVGVYQTVVLQNKPDAHSEYAVVHFLVWVWKLMCRWIEEWPCPAGLRFCPCCRDYRVFQIKCCLAPAELRHEANYSLPSLRQQLNLVIDPVVFDCEFALEYWVPLSAGAHTLILLQESLDWISTND